MQRSLSIVVAAVILIMIATSLLFIVSNSSGDYSEDNQEMIDDANCDYLQGQFESEKTFGSCELAQDIKSDASSQGCNIDDWGACEMDSQDDQEDDVEQYDPSNPPPPPGGEIA